MIAIPKLILTKPARAVIALRASSRRAAQRKGRLMAIVMSIMPPIEPRPKTKMYKIPCQTDFIVANMSSINAALPASP